MAVYQIVTEGDTVLREKAKEVPEITPNILKLLENMLHTMEAARGVGLAAPQMGISKRVIVCKTEEDQLELINPLILEAEGTEMDTEGCLSVPGRIGEVERYYRVRVQALDKAGQPVTIEREGLMARILQHEIDHLEGILFIDKAKNIRPTED